MKLKGAIIGCVFFSHNHMRAWKEIKNVEIVAACDLDKKKVSEFSKKFQISNYYTSIDELLNLENLDFVDVVTTMETHLTIAKTLAKKICLLPCKNLLQKTYPMRKKLLDFIRIPIHH